MKKLFPLLIMAFMLSACGIFDTDSTPDTYTVEYRALGHSGEFHYILIASDRSVKEDLTWQPRYMSLHEATFEPGDRVGLFLGANVAQSTAIVQVRVNGRERGRLTVVAGQNAASKIWELMPDGTLRVTDEAVIDF